MACIFVKLKGRARIVEVLSLGHSSLLLTFISLQHILYNANIITLQLHSEPSTACSVRQHTKPQTSKGSPNHVLITNFITQISDVSPYIGQNRLRTSKKSYLHSKEHKPKDHNITDQHADHSSKRTRQQPE